MFNLFRRISGSVIARPDRPWADDPTSNAPRIGRKRRLSSTDRDREDDEQERLRKKKTRGQSATTSVTDEELAHDGSSPPPDSGKLPEAEAVKEVTKGVEEVELSDKEEKGPENIPLPEEVSGELEEPAVAPAEAQRAEDEEEGSSTGAKENDDDESSASASPEKEDKEEAPGAEVKGPQPNVSRNTQGTESSLETAKSESARQGA